jgi:enoyl-CoA hydratase/carnithine racemase
MTSWTLALDDSIACLTLRAVDSKVNVLTRAVVAELNERLIDLKARTYLAGLILASGKPGLFSAGADLNEFADSLGANDPVPREYVDLTLAALATFEELPFPTVCAIDGAALGGGLEMALACDQRFAGDHPKLRLAMPEVALGLMPGFGGTQRLPRIVGPASAIALIINGVSFDGPAAVAAGLVETQVPSERLLAECANWLTRDAWRERRARKQSPVASDFPRQDAMGPAAAVALETMIDGASRTLHQGIALETEAFLKLTRSAEARERVAAFFAGKKT